MRRLALLCLALGCTTASDLRDTLATTSITLAAAQAPLDAQVGTYVSIPWGFSTSSYWLEGADGLVLIDAQFLPSAAVECVEWAEAMTGKPVVLAIVLHANPDKYNGTLRLRERGIKVITSTQVAALIPAVHEERTRAFAERYRPDWPTAVPLPESFGDATMDLEAAGLRLRLHVLGAGCSEAHVAVEWEGHLFTGDLVANGAHSWLEIGKTDEWLKRLDELEALAPKRVHPGRGPSGGPELLVRERAYLQRVIDLVAAETPTGALEGPALDALQAKVEAALPGLDLPIFLRIGLPAEWARQAGARRAAPELPDPAAPPEGRDRLLIDGPADGRR
jgi:glyoxylase-like metal-dependent hydrolase (beta-lactamase superfamily II)